MRGILVKTRPAYQRNIGLESTLRKMKYQCKNNKLIVFVQVFPYCCVPLFNTKSTVLPDLPRRRRAKAPGQRQSRHVHAAVDVQGFAGNVGGFRAGQKGDGVGDVLRVAKTV